MKKLSKCLLVSLVVYLYAYAIHTTLNGVICVFENRDFFGTLLSSVTYIFKTFFAALITHWIRVVRNPNFCGNPVEKWTTNDEETKRAHWSNYLSIWSVSSAAFAFRTRRMIAWLAQNDPQVYFTYSFYRANLTELGWSEGVAKTLIVFDWTSYNFSFFMTAVQFTTFLNSLGHLNLVFDRASLAARQILEAIDVVGAGGKRRGATGHRRFRSFDRQFLGAADEFRSVEDRFSLPLFLWISEAVAYVVLTSRRVKLNDFNQISLYGLLVDSFFYSVIFGLIIVNCARIDETYKDVLRRLGEKGVQIDPQLYVRYDLTLKAVRATRCCLTGFNFYYVDRAFGLTTVGMVFTYLVVVMQI